ncbi:MAG: hypothetical protein LUD25_02500, partial [Coriobacteriaceae bacterium]|nr:hypothetical protein [Coriobacteriaceae bacterium]
GGNTGDEGGNSGSGSSSATPYCILTDNETVGTEDTVVPVYVMGCFNPAALIMEDGYELSQDDIDALRMRGIYLSDILD